MRVTSFKDVEAYIFSRLVLPFKGLTLPELEVNSPLSGKDGTSWHLSLYQAEVSSSYRRNYQRTQARVNRNWFIGLIHLPNSYTPTVLGEISIRNSWVRLYEQPFRDIGAMPLLGKMYDVFDRDTHFSKVLVESTNHRLSASPDDRFRQFDSRRPLALEESRPYRGSDTDITGMRDSSPPRDTYSEDYDDEDGWSDD